MCDFGYLKSCKMVSGVKTQGRIKSAFEYYKQRGYVDLLDAYTKPSDIKVDIFNDIKERLTKDMDALIDIHKLVDYSLNVYIGGYNCMTFSIYFEIEIENIAGGIHKYIIYETKSKRLAVKLY